jgi:hypothetical protein
VAHGADASIYIEKQPSGNLEHDRFQRDHAPGFLLRAIYGSARSRERAEPIALRHFGFPDVDFNPAKSS